MGFYSLIVFIFEDELIVFCCKFWA